ncbi:MAG TPA: Wzz/FepE/Etk N-terminal domain-containing protein, partial [Burkholderiaceae bacterium]|nr:Wzz/FepE/Etk N-terminal domain-containing protein [Burkholderiaceae bacterium]
MNKPESEVMVPVEDEFDDGPKIGLVDLLIWLGEGKRQIAIATGVAAIGSLVLALNATPVFTARTTLLPPVSQQQGSSAALAALSSLGGLGLGGAAAKTPEELYISLLKSDSVQRELATKFNLYERYGAKTYETLRRAIPGYIRVSSDKKSGVITVEVDDKDPKFAADLANAHVGEISTLMNRLAISEAQQRRVFFDRQLKEIKENLVQAEQALRDVQEKSGMVVLDRQAEAIIKAAAELKAKIVER